MRVFPRFLFLSTILTGLVGCAGESRVFQESITVLRQADRFNDLAKTAPMASIFAYLRVHSLRGATLMILTFVDKDSKTGAPIDVWQSGSREVIKVQDGRVVASNGLDYDWLSVSYDRVPSWSRVLANTSQMTHDYRRVVDYKAKYQFGQTQQLVLSRISQPVGHALAGIQQPDIVWFEEKILNSALPPNIYGVVPNWNKSGQAKVVYTWHCFSANECMGFQVWTTIDQDYVKAAKP